MRNWTTGLHAWFAQLTTSLLQVVCLLVVVLRNDTGQDGDKPCGQNKRAEKQRAAATELARSIKWTLAHPFHTAMCKQPREAEQQSHDQIMEGLERTQMWFNGLLAFCAALGFWVAIWQGCQTQSMLYYMRIEQRPWFRVELTPTEELAGGKPFAFELAITNAGKSIGTFRGQATETIPLMQPGGTPGNGRFRNIGGTLIIELDEKALNEAEAALILENSHAVVPDQTIRVAPGGQHPLIPEVIPLIKSGKIIVVVLVIVEYSDIQGDKHRTRACFVYDPNKKTCFEYSRYHYMN